jgi:hypothetical protein
MQQPHPIATACGIILALAFGLFCLCASDLTSVPQVAAHGRLVHAQLKVHGPTPRSDSLTTHP